MKGAADDSYGIEVAQLAGVPREVVKRAKEILSDMETGENESKKPEKKQGAADPTMFTFTNMMESEVCEKLKGTDINTISPLEALNLLFELKKMLN